MDNFYECRHGTVWTRAEKAGKPVAFEMVESAGAGCFCNVDEAEEVERDV